MGGLKGGDEVGRWRFSSVVGFTPEAFAERKRSGEPLGAADETDNVGGFAADYACEVGR